MTKNCKICVVCGCAFSSPPSDKTVTCSKHCSAIHRSDTHKGKSNRWNKESKKNLSVIGMTDNLKKGTPAALISPNAGHFETNVNAKDWHILSPEGKHYYFRNLNLWAEQNYSLFGFTNPDDARKVRSGIRLAKRGAEGKKVGACTYKGWKVII